MRWTQYVTAVTALACCHVQDLRADTLGEVLAAHRVPENTLSAGEREQRITSFAVSADATPFLLAYYNDDGSQTLPSVLHLLRYEEGSGHLQRAALSGADAPFAFDQMMHTLPRDCLGSALSITERSGVIALDTHVSPSAGCVLVLTTDLHFNVALPGWTLGRLGELLVIEESMRQFAPTHPARLAIYDSRREVLQRVYPQGGDPNRTAFAEEIRRHLPSHGWCEANNNPCDPEEFTAQIDHVAFNPAGNAFTFDVTMEAEGFGEDTASAVRQQTVHYLCTLRGGDWKLSSE